MNYYNEFDSLKAEVLREAIKARAIAQGDVDERSISDVRPADLAGYTQCHFFAGGGFWDLTLRNAGWPDDRPVWTGSCPCPSFSAAGKGGGFDDPRHLWPDWARLIRECRPPVIFGEQADAAVGFGWVDLVQTDLEAEAYAFGKVVFGAHSVGAPHIRQRLYFCADTDRQPCERRTGSVSGAQTQGDGERFAVDGCGPFRLKHGEQVGVCADTANGDRWRGERGERGEEAGVGQNGERRRGPASDGPALSGADAERNGGRTDFAGRQSQGRVTDGRDRAVSNSPDSDGGFTSNGDLQRRGEHGLFTQDRGTGEHHNSVEDGRGARRHDDRGDDRQFACADGVTSVGIDAVRAGLQGLPGDVRDWRGPGWLDPQQARSIAETGATRGFWADCDWWYGSDGKYRPIGPGLQPLAHGSPARVGRLRLYGDAIVTTQAAEFIKAYLEARGE